jgi:hypothetical protein
LSIYPFKKESEMRLQSMATAGAALSLMGLLLGTVEKTEAVQLSRVTDIGLGSEGPLRRKVK